MPAAKKSIALILVLAGFLGALILYFLNLVPWMPPAAAREAEVIDKAFRVLTLVTVPIFSLVTAAVVYMALRFRESDGREGPRIHGTRKHAFEISWIVLSTVLTLGLAAYGMQEFFVIRGAPGADLDVQVRAAQWSWEFYYPAYNIHTTELYLPIEKRVRVSLNSEDVIHSFWIPAFRLKQDALPGRVTTVMFTPVLEGQYDLVCAELCGLDHSLMRGRVSVVSWEEFEEKLKGEAW